MKGTKIPKLDEYWTAFEKALPDFPADEQRVAVTLYRELARGEPVTADRLAAALDISPENARDALARGPLRAFAYPDDEGRVIGFGGLAVAPMHHELRLTGRKLWTWCAWDTLFVPRILGESAEVASPDPETGEIVRLSISPERIESAEPRGALVSFLSPAAGDFDRSAANVMAKFCHYVFFFATRESGERWAARHRGTFLYSLEEAFELGRRLAAKQFGAELARRANAACIS